MRNSNEHHVLGNSRASTWRRLRTQGVLLAWAAVAVTAATGLGALERGEPGAVLQEQLPPAAPASAAPAAQAALPVEAAAGSAGVTREVFYYIVGSALEAWQLESGLEPQARSGDVERIFLVGDDAAADGIVMNLLALATSGLSQAGSRSASSIFGEPSMGSVRHSRRRSVRRIE